MYSRGKSHILRLAVPIQALLQFFETIAEDASSGGLELPHPSSDPSPSQSSEQTPSQSSDQQERSDAEELTDNEQNSDEDDEQKLSQTNTPQTGSMISATAISVATSIVKCCLEQLSKCMLTLYSLTFTTKSTWYSR